MREYPSVQTYTVQSAFKYDYPHDVVREGIRKINETSPGKAPDVDEKRCLEIINKCSISYRDQIIHLAPLINDISKLVPRRRMRKLHIGLFGYSRSLEGVKLPRAISFCCAFYSIGIPPEILGLDALSDEDIQYVREVSPFFDDNMKDALRYLNPASLKLVPEIVSKAVERLRLDVEPDEEHQRITSRILDNINAEAGKGLEDLLLRAAYLRGFLG